MCGTTCLAQRSLACAGIAAVLGDLRKLRMPTNKTGAVTDAQASKLHCAA